MMRTHRLVAALVVLGLLWSLAPAGAQSLHRVQSRAKVWDVFWNNGVQGVNEQQILTYYRPMGFSYPGQMWMQVPTNEFAEYWGVRFWSGASQWLVWEHELTATLPGFNIFVGTRLPGDADGEYYVNESKPARLSDDIVPMAYDPSQGPEANIGYQSLSPLGPPQANWWPGQAPPGADGPVEIINYRFSEYMDADKDMFPENTIICQWTTKRGIQVTKKIYTWSYPQFDDFEIMEFEFENTGDSDGDGVADLNGGAGYQLNDTFFTLSTRFHVAHSGHAWQNYDNWYRNVKAHGTDDWNKYTEAANYDGPSDGVGLKMWYTYDGDNPLTPGDDLGQPYRKAEARYDNRIPGIRQEGELTAYQYVGFAPLAFTPGAANDPETFTFDTGGDASYVAPGVTDQPYATKNWDFRNKTDYDEPDTATYTMQAMFEALAGPAPSIADNPTEQVKRHHTEAFGPYDMALGDKAKVVVVLVAAAPVEENLWGWALEGKQDDLRGDKAWKNLVKHHQAARDAFRWGYDVPDAPPDVPVTTGASIDGFNELTWPATGDGASDPDYTGAEAQDIVGYKVYQSQFKWDNWTLKATIPKGGGSYTWQDESSVAGFAYYYSVRAYDSGHADFNGTGIAVPSSEGGNQNPATYANGVMFDSPFVPANTAADGLTRDVRVVPNPYRDDGAHAYPSKGQVRITNIPHHCMIKIYTVAGDLFSEIEHNDPTKGEYTWLMLSDDFVENASSGLYYLHVESLVPASLGKTHTGSFMVVK